MTTKLKNESGFVPVEYKCLVKPEEVEEKTAGGLFLPDMAKDKQQMAQVYGILIDVGGLAFEGWAGTIPEPGDRVLFAKYAGLRDAIGPNDGQKYWFINDKDLIAIVETGE